MVEGVAFAKGAAIIVSGAISLTETVLRYNMLKAQAEAAGRTEFTEEELAMIRGERKAAVAAALGGAHTGPVGAASAPPPDGVGG